MDRQIGIAAIMASCVLAALAVNCQPSGSDPPPPTPTLRPTAGPTTPTNKPPEADAGPDQTVADADGSGDEKVQLDGSGCSDEDGTIVSYAWSETGVDIATGVDPTVTLAVGTHIILLVVTDDAGGSGSENVKIKVEAPLPTPTLLPGTPSPTDTPGPGTPSATPIPGTTPTETSTPALGTSTATPTPPPAATEAPTATDTPEATPTEPSEPTVEPTATTVPAATPSGETVTLDLGDGVTMELVLILGGDFEMGSDHGVGSVWSEEEPVHWVSVPTFYMGKYEVTQAQWQAVMGSDPSLFVGDDRPVEKVSWDEAKAFCAALADMTEYAIRLPSESEWEYACRVGTTTDYHFGDDVSVLGDYGWYDSNSENETHPVGQKTPNAFGLHDMYGNVWEWCEDWFHDNYEGAPTDGSAWISPAGTLRVLRGGAYDGDYYYCRSAVRRRIGPDSHVPNAGFRVSAGTL